MVLDEHAFKFCEKITECFVRNLDNDVGVYYLLTYMFFA